MQSSEVMVQDLSGNATNRELGRFLRTRLCRRGKPVNLKALAIDKCERRAGRRKDEGKLLISRRMLNFHVADEGTSEHVIDMYPLNIFPSLVRLKNFQRIANS
jgi:hypothetical protein